MAPMHQQCYGAGWDIRTGLIGPGVDASHSLERTHKDGVEATIKLGIAYLYDLVK